MIWTSDEGAPRDPARAMNILDELDDLQADRYEPPFVRGGCGRSSGDVLDYALAVSLCVIAGAAVVLGWLIWGGI
jgi:hypothetical protein